MRQYINRLASKLLSHSLPTVFSVEGEQRRILLRLVRQFTHSPLYKTLGIKQDQLSSIPTTEEIKRFLGRYPLVDYSEHIFPLQASNSGITHPVPDLFITTSGTSVANQSGKRIPAQWSSFGMERSAVANTLGHYLAQTPQSKLLGGTSFALTAPFDSVTRTGYVSGAMRASSPYLPSRLYPSRQVLQESDRSRKKTMIVQELFQDKVSISSIHGVPTWPLDILQEVVQTDPIMAKSILSELEYVSIGGGPALSYKQQFQSLLDELGIGRRLAGSNNHNASEGFFGSQLYNFTDLEYHRMCPVYWENFFLYVPVDQFALYQSAQLSYSELIMQSHLLHEVQPEQEYLMMFANRRIPWIYNIKDKVVFKKNSIADRNSVLEYLVTGRYGMASNVCNEHLEAEHIVACLQSLGRDSYHRVGGMENIDNNFVFHLILEGEQDNTLSEEIDSLLSQKNDQRALFRSRKKIVELTVHYVPVGGLRQGLIALGKMHEQSKIPHLSDVNFDHIVSPLVEYRC